MEVEQGAVSDREETVIIKITGHKRVGKGMRFEVLWEDGDITWEKRSNIEDCTALDEYLLQYGVADPSDLPKTKPPPIVRD